MKNVALAGTVAACAAIISAAAALTGRSPAPPRLAADPGARLTPALRTYSDLLRTAPFDPADEAAAQRAADAWQSAVLSGAAGDLLPVDLSDQAEAGVKREILYERLQIASWLEAKAHQERQAGQIDAALRHAAQSVVVAAAAKGTSWSSIAESSALQGRSALLISRIAPLASAGSRQSAFELLSPPMLGRDPFLALERHLAILGAADFGGQDTASAAAFDAGLAAEAAALRYDPGAASFRALALRSEGAFQKRWAEALAALAGHGLEQLEEAASPEKISG
jgi:hypothetical protein